MNCTDQLLPAEQKKNIRKSSVLIIGTGTAPVPHLGLQRITNVWMRSCERPSNTKRWIRYVSFVFGIISSIIDHHHFRLVAPEVGLFC